jgi:hypothetical protein
MPHHSLRLLTVPIPRRLQRIQNTPHLFLLVFRQFHIPGSEVLLKTLRLRRSRNGNHALRNHPRQSNLRQRTPFTLCQSFDLLDDFLVVVEVLALEFGNYRMSESAANFKYLVGHERERIWTEGMVEAYQYDGSHRERSLRDFRKGSHRRASRGLAGCRLRRRCLVRGLWR